MKNIEIFSDFFMYVFIVLMTRKCRALYVQMGILKAKKLCLRVISFFLDKSPAFLLESPDFQKNIFGMSV